MPTLLSLGYEQTLTQNVIFALPGVRCLLFTDAVAPTIQQSTDFGFAASITVALTNGQAELAGGFIRCTSATIDVLLKAA